jgi:putative transposase
MDRNWFSPIITETICINMPFTKVYIHFIWSTKDRQPFLNSKVLREKIWEHLRENAKGKGIFIDTINGHQEHCHCLISLGIDQTMSKIMQLMKGESSYWINKHQLCKQKFEWQDEYFAISVSGSMVDKVREYIKNQEEHHKTNTFQQEFDEFIQKCGFNKLKEGFAKSEDS